MGHKPTVYYYSSYISIFHDYITFIESYMRAEEKNRPSSSREPIYKHYLII